MTLARHPECAAKALVSEAFAPDLRSPGLA
jgi:hypothetical protein